MFALLRRGRQLQLPVDIMIHLFYPLVKPVLLYASEIWAHEGTKILEKLHLRFCKYILLVNKTCLNMVYGELGEYPLILSAQTRMIMFWANISQDTEKTKISNLMYQLLYKLNREMCINRLGSIVLKRFWKIVVSLVYGKVKSSLAVRNATNNKSNKDYSISLVKNGQQKSNKAASV